MLKEVFLFSVVVFFAGCSLKNEKSLSKSLEKSLEFDTHMQKTEKITINDMNETKISLTLSYLNSNESIVDEENSVNEKFIVGIYRADGLYGDTLMDDTQSLSIHIDYPKPKRKEKLTREEIAERAKGRDSLPVVLKRIALDDPLLRNMSMVNSWSSYYYVEFPHSINKRFIITYQNKIYGTKENLVDGEVELEYIKYHLHFAKNGKYIYANGKKLFK